MLVKHEALKRKRVKPARRDEVVIVACFAIEKAAHGILAVAPGLKARRQAREIMAYADSIHHVLIKRAMPTSIDGNLRLET